MKKDPNFALLHTDLVVSSLALVTCDLSISDPLWRVTDELIGLVQYSPPGHQRIKGNFAMRRWGPEEQSQSCNASISAVLVSRYFAWESWYAAKLENTGQLNQVFVGQNQRYLLGVFARARYRAMTSRLWAIAANCACLIVPVAS